MNSQQIHGPIRGKCQHMLDHDKGQNKHLSSMSCLWRTTRMSMDDHFSICSLRKHCYWVGKAPRLSISIVIWILSFDTLFLSSTDSIHIVRRQCCLLLRLYWELCWSHSILNPQRVRLRLADFRLWSLETSFTLIARSGFGIFQRLEYCLQSRKTGSLRRLPTAYPPCTERPVSHV